LKSPKRSVSLVIEGPDGLLLVRRPEGAVRRAGREKLGVEVAPLRPVGSEGTMTDWEVRIVAGRPSVPQQGPNTQYTELRWGEPLDLVPAAREGSLCCRALLRARGLDW
jgi:hypothetical protein